MSDKEGKKRRVGPPTGVEVYDAGAQAEEAEVVGLVLSPADTANTSDEDIARMMAEQAESAVTMKPVGGSSHDPGVKAELARQKDPFAHGVGLVLGIDLLESEYPSMVGLLTELYARLESGRVEVNDLGVFDHTKGMKIGVIDYRAEEYLCVGREAIASSLVETSDYLGIDRKALLALLRTPEGRQWLFTGEDPSEYEEAAEGDTEAEVEELSGLWDTPEVVDEWSLPEENAFGSRESYRR
jgi:hypothetical protein